MTDKQALAEKIRERIEEMQIAEMRMRGPLTQSTRNRVDKPTTTEEKKAAPHWMDCNCECHGFGDVNDSCPHCKPDKYPTYTTEEESQ